VRDCIRRSNLGNNVASFSPRIDHIHRDHALGIWARAREWKNTFIVPRDLGEISWLPRARSRRDLCVWRQVEKMNRYICGWILDSEWCYLYEVCLSEPGLLGSYMCKRVRGSVDAPKLLKWCINYIFRWLKVHGNELNYWPQQCVSIIIHWSA